MQYYGYNYSFWLDTSYNLHLVFKPSYNQAFSLYKIAKLKTRQLNFIFI